MAACRSPSAPDPGWLWQAEGDLWGALSLLVQGGCLREAILLLRRSGQPDCALAFQAACRQAGFHAAEGPSDSGAVHVMGQVMGLQSFLFRCHSQCLACDQQVCLARLQGPFLAQGPPGGWGSAGCLQAASPGGDVPVAWA